jgi:hypothetical protein
MDINMKNTITKQKKKLHLEIGDSKQDEFYPQLKSKHWDNDCNFSVRLLDDEQGTYKIVDDKIEWYCKDKTARFYDIDTDNFEFEVEFNKKPDNNIIYFSIRHKSLWFEKQPMKEKEGESIPENVKGSYAVYHSKKQGFNNTEGCLNYKSGKAMHIYRPEVVDKDGNRAWCKLNIDYENDLMTIEIPQDFLDIAVYPIILDPTYGYTSIGASTLTVSGGSFIGSFIRNIGKTNTLYAYAKNVSTSNKYEFRFCTINEGEFISNSSSNYINLGTSWGWKSLSPSGGITTTETNVHFMFKSNSQYQIRYDAYEKAGVASYNIQRDYEAKIDRIYGYTFANRIYSLYGEYEEYGAVFVNNTKVVIDGSYYNLTLHETGTLEPNQVGTNYHSLTGGNVPIEQMPALMATKLRSDNLYINIGINGTILYPREWYPEPVGGSFMYFSSQKNYYDSSYQGPRPDWVPEWYPWDDQDDSVTYNHDYAVFTNALNRESPPYGMEIYNSDGDKVFSSGSRQMKIVGVYTLPSMPNTGLNDPEDASPKYISVVSATNNYFFIGPANNYGTPHAIWGHNEILSAEYDDDDLFNPPGWDVTVATYRSVYTCAMYRHNSTTVGIKWAERGISFGYSYKLSGLSNKDVVYTMTAPQLGAGTSGAGIFPSDYISYGYGVRSYTTGSGVLYEVTF